MDNFSIPPVLSRQNLGRLILDVTSDPSLSSRTPIEDVTVVLQATTSDGSQVPIAELTTNASGQTPVIELPTPPEGYSLDIENTQQPYSTYTVIANNPNYVTTVIEGVQIFENTTSIQPVFLQSTGIVPSLNSVASRKYSRKAHNKQTYSRQPEDLFVIGPSTLFGNYPPKIPEASIKPLISSNFIVLDEVVVPEFIIVHDGLPNNNSAPNYEVRFTDYIKNVASSEIYPTWPTQTIIANVIAITSFTLNRVYTEWYRNQGKSFIITNSTAYDHAFFFGRNIFESISRVVDEYFDFYVKRPNVTQPLLTQYCDGKRSQCPNWMTQWGSQALGEDGLSYSEILRYYYGSDITFPIAPEIAGLPESYPGSPLSLGDTGPAVRTIQEQLNRISNNYPAIPKVRSNGVFDENTAQAVRTFQQVFHLTPDGIVGKSTWYKISQIYVAVTRIAELR